MQPHEEKHGKPLTIIERRSIQEGLRAGKSCSSIARELNRAKNAIVTEVRRNGGKELYDALSADNEAINRNEKRKETLSKINSGNSHFNKVFNRLRNLEMQIQILSEAVKELLNAKNKRS